MTCVGVPHCMERGRGSKIITGVSELLCPSPWTTPEVWWSLRSSETSAGREINCISKLSPAEQVIGIYLCQTYFSVCPLSIFIFPISLDFSVRCMMGNNGSLTYTAFQTTFSVRNLIGYGKFPGDKERKQTGGWWNQWKHLPLCFFTRPRARCFLWYSQVVHREFIELSTQS